MEDVARVVLGLEEHDVAEEVMHFLDRTGRARVVATAFDPQQLAEAVRQLEPDAVVASPRIARLGRLNGSVLLAVDTRESVQSLRGAIAAGAHGFYLWPADREELAGATARLAAGPPTSEKGTGRIVAVYGPRGGAGATFVVTHLAAAMARRDRSCVLLDLDLGMADLTAALGVPAEPATSTIADVDVSHDLSSRAFTSALWAHPEGFRVLLAPAEPYAGQLVDVDAVRHVLDVARVASDVVLVHLPRGLDERTRTVLDEADRVIVVLQLDVQSFRSAKRAIAATGVADRSRFVVNRAGRSEIAPADVERAFGRPALAVVPVDRGVGPAQDQGRLLPLRGRTGRAIDRVARWLLEELEETS